jgi:hypothetical protein
MGYGRAYAFQALGKSLADLPKLFEQLRQQRDSDVLDKLASLPMPSATLAPAPHQPVDPAQPDPEQGKGTGLPLTDPSAPPDPAQAPQGMPSGGPMTRADRLRFVADQLRKQGKGALALQLDAKAELADKEEWDTQKSRFQAITESLGSRKSGLDLLGHMANGVTDQRGADTARAAMLTVMQQSGFSQPEIQYAQEVAGKPGDPFDPKAWANVVHLTQTYGQTLTDQHAALQVVGQGYTNAENKTKAEEAAFTATVKHLLTNPQQYAANRALAVAVDPRMGQVLPKDWNTDTETRLTGYLEGAEKVATLAGQAAGQAETARHNRAEEKLAAERLKLTSGGALSAEDVAYWVRQVQADPTVKALITDQAMKKAVDAGLAKAGVDLNKLSSQTRQMGETADAILPMITQIEAQARALDQKGVLGPIAGRWADFLAGKLGAGEVAGGDAKTAQEIGRFRTDLGLLTTAVARAHGGARAGGSIQMIEHLSTFMTAMKQDYPTFIGSLQGTRDWMQEYSDRLHGKNLVASPQGGGGNVTVLGKDGQSYTFPTQAAADAFKKAGG